MGHYCRICGCERPNEQFSGKGHTIHVCKRCQARPKSERLTIEDKDDIFGFLQQSHISERNVARLERMTKSDNPQVASLAAIVLDVARVKPYKTRRLKFLAQKHPELLGKLRDTGLILVPLARVHPNEFLHSPLQVSFLLVATSKTYIKWSALS